MEGDRVKFLLVALALYSTGVLATPDTDVIYGEDHRRDFFEFEDPVHMLKARSTAGMVKNFRLKRQKDHWQLVTDEYGSSYGLCETERFWHQRRATFCTAFLVGPQTMVTAGHCIRTEARCASSSFVFDYITDQLGNPAPEKFSPDQVYQCARVIHTENKSNGADFAVVELDRPVKGRTPLSLRTHGTPELNTPLFVLGHPVGIPLKLADGGWIRKLNSDFFVANLDTYGSNSGSPVFNGSTGQVEGILVRGERDFVRTDQGCRVSKKCSNTKCKGEDVSLISKVLPHLSQIPTGDAPSRPYASTAK